MAKRQELKLIKAEDVKPKHINERFTSIRLKEKDQFIEMAASKSFNASPGSIFVDDSKSYFFNSSLCYILRGESDEREN